MDELTNITYGIYMKDNEIKREISNSLPNSFYCSINEISLNEVLKALRENNVDLLMIGNNEIVMIPVLIREFTQLKIVVISDESNEDKVGFAIGNGVSGFIIPPINQLDTQLHQVLSEGYYFPFNVMEKFISSYKKAVDTNSIKEEKEYRKPLHLLTRRECEVLQLLAEGKSNREVGQILYISEKTVKNHVSNILMKLKVKDRTKAVLMAIKKSWVYVS
jgi:two-component system, NarL family, response regulator DegU